MIKDDNDLSDDEVQPVFYYNREKRIKKAPEAVQRAWKEGYTPQRGFIKGLTANAGLKSILFAIVLLTLAIFFVSIFGQKEGTASFQNIDFKLKSFLFDETIYTTLSTTSKIIPDGPVLVSVIFTGLDNSGESVSKSTVEGTFTGKELLLRATIHDFEIQQIHAIINLKNTTLEIQVSVDRK